MINVNFTNEIDVITTVSLYQWDTSQIINLSGVTANEVHFANKKSEYALAIKITNGSVQIPNSLLQQKYDIVGYIYITNGTGGQTIKLIKIPVEERKKPSYYTETTDEDVIEIQKIELEAKVLIDNLTASEYSSSITYNKPNIVYYQGNAYMCIESCKGILPTDTSKWQLICRGSYLTSMSKDTQGNLVFNYQDGSSYTVSIATQNVTVVDSNTFPALGLTVYDVNKIKDMTKPTPIIAYCYANTYTGAYYEKLSTGYYHIIFYDKISSDIRKNFNFGIVYIGVDSTTNMVKKFSTPIAFEASTKNAVGYILSNSMAKEKSILVRKVEFKIVDGAVFLQYTTVDYGYLLLLRLW